MIERGQESRCGLHVGKVRTANRGTVSRVPIERMQPRSIRSTPRPSCYLCGQPGAHLYEGLADRMFDTPGVWNIQRCSNTQCQLLWLDPCPVESDLGKLYESYYTHEGAPKHAQGEASLAARLRWFVKFGYFPRTGAERHELGLVLKGFHRLASFVLPPLVADLPAGKPGRLLDLGCGDGDLMRAAQDREWNAEGVDFDPASVEFARRRGLNVHLGSLVSQDYAAEQFDAIVMSHVVEHLSDPIGVLQECHRVLKPGGRLILATPNVGSQFHRKFGKHWVHLDPPRHLYLFGVNTLTEVVRRSRFNNPLKCFTVLGAPFAYGASELIRRNGHFTVRSDGTIGINLQACLMILVELANLKAGRHLGEELRLMVDK